ncbi:2OG-Fe(II) oxygenase [Gimibacter soli]|uniref:2OG-Fe(II) oxygenase family protein n=1 Tax=Gimibacter soli TaxID=3024400 RepID=A0AAE9XQD3_9PROT|nr:2OG-Fe(II) oxygenase family protein [Gimibacter soli]WCL54446.1 2OG-Fe(II) oxygenase family protein [Gimibacter soli]
MTEPDTGPILNPALDGAALARLYGAAGRLHIAGIMTEPSAKALHDVIATFADWNLSLRKGDGDHSIPPEQRRHMSADQMATLRRLIDMSATQGFQYLFENYPIYDACHAGIAPPAFRQLFDFLNGEAFLGLMRQITGHSDIGFADAQVTRFTAGDFLTTHDDDVDGKDRRAAYVLNLTPSWRADWGGILQFLDGDGHVEAGFVPSFNALNLFSVPKLHAVSQVSTFSPGARLSVTGWLRAGKDPGPAQ